MNNRRIKTGRRHRSGLKTLTALLLAVLVFCIPTMVYAEFHYVHDPMENPEAAKDIIVNPDAVYGYSPNPDSVRLGAYADEDWTDPEKVAKWRAERAEYHAQNAELYQMINTMKSEGKSVEEIARAVSSRRNEIRIESYKDDAEGLEKLKKSNLETYGHEEGPTPDELYEKYGSWQKVIEKALSSNPGMDACLGFYDEMYDTYDISGQAPDAGQEDKSPATNDTGSLFPVWVLLSALCAGIAVLTPIDLKLQNRKTHCEN